MVTVKVSIAWKRGKQTGTAQYTVVGFDFSKRMIIPVGDGQDLSAGALKLKYFVGLMILGLSTKGPFSQCRMMVTAKKGAGMVIANGFAKKKNRALWIAPMSVASTVSNPRLRDLTSIRFQ